MDLGFSLRYRYSMLHSNSLVLRLGVVAKTFPVSVSLFPRIKKNRPAMKSVGGLELIKPVRCL